MHGPRRLTRKPGPDTLWPEIWKDMSEASKRKEKQKWAVEKPKLDNARKLRGINFIDPADEEFKDILKTRVESWKFRCQLQCLAKLDVISPGRPVAFKRSARQDTLACSKADESTRKRMEGPLHEDHEDHVAGKGMNSSSRLQSCTQIYSHASSNENTRCESLQWFRSGRSSRQSQHGNWRKSRARRKSSWKHKETNRKSTVPH